MKIIRINPENDREISNITQQLGQRFSLSEMINMGGTGSPQIYYKPGNIELNELLIEANRPIKLQFELYKKGLLTWIHLSRNYTFCIPLASDRACIYLDEKIYNQYQSPKFSDHLRESITGSLVWFLGNRQVPDSPNYVTGSFDIQIGESIFSVYLDQHHHFSVLRYLKKIQKIIPIKKTNSV